jgi:GT2 family glycosyltransferase
MTSKVPLEGRSARAEGDGSGGTGVLSDKRDFSADARQSGAAALLERHEAQLQRIETGIQRLETRIDELQQLTASAFEAGSAQRDLMIDRKRRSLRGRLAPKLGVLYHHPPRTLEIPARYRAPQPLDGLPSLSIVTPSYQHAVFLERTLQSVLNQAHGPLEYIVQDGGSTDGTAEILSRYGAALTRWESATDSGQAEALNRGFRHATGEILAYLNSDDLLLPGALAYVARYFAEHPEIDVVYGHRVLIDEEDCEVGRWVLPRHEDEVLSWADYVPQETLFWRRRIWEKVGARFDTDFSFALDWDLLLRFRDAGARFERVPRFLGAFRVHLRQKTSANMQSAGRPEMNRLRTRCHGRPVSDAEAARHVRPYLMKHLVCHKLYRLGLLRY